MNLHIKRGISSENKVQRAASQDSSTSIESAEARPRHYDTKYPKNLVRGRGQLKQRGRASNVSLHNSYTTFNYIQQVDQAPEKVDQVALEDQQVKVKKAKCFMITDHNQFNLPAPLKINLHQYHYSKPLAQDIAEVVEVDDKETPKPATPFKLKVDQLDELPKSRVVQQIQQILEQKNDDEQRPKQTMFHVQSKFIRKIMMSQSEIISEEDEARNQFERNHPHDSSNSRDISEQFGCLAQEPQLQ